MLQILKDFLAKVEGSTKGILVAEELYRSILGSLGSGSAIGLVLMVLQTILAHATSIFPNPLVGSLATMILTLVIDLIRRLNQGDSPAPAPAPAPASA